MLVDKIMIDVPHRGTLGVVVDFYYVTAVLQKGKCSVLFVYCVGSCQYML